LAWTVGLPATVGSVTAIGMRVASTAATKGPPRAPTSRTPRSTANWLARCNFGIHDGAAEQGDIGAFGIVLPGQGQPRIAAEFPDLAAARVTHEAQAPILPQPAVEIGVEKGPG
jgi:hypothetical protein